MFVRYALGFLSAAVIGLVAFSVQPSPQRDALVAFVTGNNSSGACNIDGAFCSADQDCCYSRCQGGVCGGVVDDGNTSSDFSCNADGESCDVDEDCCDSLCGSGICGGDTGSSSSAPECRANGAFCADDVFCCSGNCALGTCQPAPASSAPACLGSNENCLLNPSGCCNSGPTPLSCQLSGVEMLCLPTSSCIATGQFCMFGAECCNGICESNVCGGTGNVSSPTGGSSSSAPPTVPPSSSPPSSADDASSSASSVCPTSCTGGSIWLQILTLGFAGQATCVVDPTCSIGGGSSANASETPGPSSPPSSPSSSSSSSSSPPSKVCCTVKVDDDGDEVRGCELTPSQTACDALGPDSRWIPAKESCSASDYADNLDPCLQPDLVAYARPLLGGEETPISEESLFTQLGGQVVNEGEGTAHNVTAIFTVPSPLRVGTDFEFASGGTCTINKARNQITCTAAELAPGDLISIGAFVSIPEGTSPLPECNQRLLMNAEATTSDTEMRSDNNNAQHAYIFSCGVCCPNVDDTVRTCTQASPSQCPTDDPFLPPTWLAPPHTCASCPKAPASSSSASSVPSTGACCYVNSTPPNFSTTIERNMTKTQCEIVKKGIYHPGDPSESEIACPTAGDITVTKSGPDKTAVKPGDTLTYTVTVSNASDTDITGTIGMVDQANPWLVVEGSLPDGCQKLQSIISCEMHGLAGGDSKSFTFTFTVSPSACPNNTSISHNSATVFAGAGSYDVNPRNNTAFSGTATLLCGTEGVCCTYAAGKPTAQCAGPSTESLCTGTDKTFVPNKQCSDAKACPERPVGTCCGFMGSQLATCQKNVTLSGCPSGDFHEGKGDGETCAQICTPPEYGTCCTLSGCEAKSTESRCTLIGGKWTKGENKCAECKPLGPCCKGPSVVQCQPATTEDDCDADGGLWLGQGKYCSFCQHEVGVCCGGDGKTIENVTEEMCSAFTGIGQPSEWIAGKDKNACPKVGACCVPDPMNDNCAQLTYKACLVKAGTSSAPGYGKFQGEGVACPSVCKPSEPVGACCREGWPCKEAVTRSDCEGMSPPGRWSEKKSCADACPEGACCYRPDDGLPHCQNFNSYECEKKNGIPHPGKACDACQKWVCMNGGANSDDEAQSCLQVSWVPSYYTSALGPFDTKDQCITSCPKLEYCCTKDTNQCSPVMSGVNCNRETRTLSSTCDGKCAPTPTKEYCCTSGGCKEVANGVSCDSGTVGSSSDCSHANKCQASTKYCCSSTSKKCESTTAATCPGGGTPTTLAECEKEAACKEPEKKWCCDTASKTCTETTGATCPGGATPSPTKAACEQVPACKKPPTGGGCCIPDTLTCSKGITDKNECEEDGFRWYDQNCATQCAKPVASCGPDCEPAINGVCSLIAQKPRGWLATVLANLGFRTAQFDEGTDLDGDGIIDCCCKPKPKPSGSSSSDGTVGGVNGTTGGGGASSSSKGPEPKCGPCQGDSKASCEGGAHACEWEGGALGFLQVLFGGSGGTCVPAPQCRGGASSASRSSAVSTRSASSSSSSSDGRVFYVIGLMLRSNSIACLDGIDNDKDGRTDDADPGCYDAGQARNEPLTSRILASIGLLVRPKGTFLPQRNSELCDAGMYEVEGKCVALPSCPAASGDPAADQFGITLSCVTQCGANVRCAGLCTCNCTAGPSDVAAAQICFNTCLSRETHPECTPIANGRTSQGKTAAECCSAACVSQSCAP